MQQPIVSLFKREPGKIRISRKLQLRVRNLQEVFGFCQQVSILHISRYTLQAGKRSLNVRQSRHYRRKPLAGLADPVNLVLLPVEFCGAAPGVVLGFRESRIQLVHSALVCVHALPDLALEIAQRVAESIRTFVRTKAFQVQVAERRD